jgi:uncharacterized membrane protein YfcA
VTPATLALAVGVLALAGFVQGLTGFGFGMIAMGLLPQVLGLERAQAIVTVAGLTAFLAMTGLTLRDVRWSSVDLWISSTIGVPLGFLVLTELPQAALLRLLGLFICVLALFELAVARGRTQRLPSWAGWGVGLASGALSGAFNIGGPPLVAYIYGQPWSNQERVATLSGLFLTTGLIRLALLLVAGELTGATWGAAAWAAGPMVLAVVGGNRALRHLPQRGLAVAVNVALLVLGGRYLITGS